MGVWWGDGAEHCELEGIVGGGHRTPCKLALVFGVWQWHQSDLVIETESEECSAHFSLFPEALRAALC